MPGLLEKIGLRRPSQSSDRPSPPNSPGSASPKRSSFSKDRRGPGHRSSVDLPSSRSVSGAGAGAGLSGRGSGSASTTNLPGSQQHGAGAVTDPAVSGRGYGEDQLVGRGGHIDGSTEVAENLNGILGGSGGGSGGHTSTPTKSGLRTGTGGTHTPPADIPGRRSSLDQTRGSTPGSAGAGVIKGTPIADRFASNNARSAGQGNLDHDLMPVSSTGDAGPNSGVGAGIGRVPSASDKFRAASGGHERTASIPRSPAKFALPTIPPTPNEFYTPTGAMGGESANLEAGRGEFDQLIKENGGYANADIATNKALPPAPHGHGHGRDELPGSGLNHKDGSTNFPFSKHGHAHRGEEIKLVDAPRGTQPVEHHLLTPPPSLHGYMLPDPSIAFKESGEILRGKPIEEITRAAKIKGPNPAYTSSREYRYHPFPPAATDEELADHFHRHLDLYKNQGVLFNASMMHMKKPGKVQPLKASPPVLPRERDQILTNERTALVKQIIASETTAVQEGKRLRKAKDGLEPHIVERFERAGWKERLGVLDTVEIGTKVFEPVVQEHVVPIETNVYELMIFRDIHKYHIYPYIQPIFDPKPTVLPTRHLFRDRDGNWREVIGDEAAERVLGRKLTRSAEEGEYYEERWIESVDGITYEYSTIEAESVKVGRRGWVELVGDRLLTSNSTASTSTNEQVGYAL